MLKFDKLFHDRSVREEAKIHTYYGTKWKKDKSNEQNSMKMMSKVTFASSLLNAI